jgi:hypothetical protein
MHLSSSLATPGRDGNTAIQRIHQTITDPPSMLLMVQTDLKTHSGTIECDPDARNNSQTRHCRFPVAGNSRQHRSSAGKQRETEPQRLPIKDLSQYRVLLVEDNIINQDVARELLQKWSVNVHIAWHGKEALEKVQQNKYDMILMDIQMPSWTVSPRPRNSQTPESRAEFHPYFGNDRACPHRRPRKVSCRRNERVYPQTCRPGRIVQCPGPMGAVKTPAP